METTNRKLGRPEKLKTSRVNVTLDPDTVAAAKQLGNGNLSKGLRIAVEQSRELERFRKELTEYRIGKAPAKEAAVHQENRKRKELRLTSDWADKQTLRPK